MADRPCPPLLVDEHAPGVAIEVVDKLVEDPHRVQLALPCLGVGRSDLLLQARSLVHEELVHPPGERGLVELVAPLDRDRHHAQPQEAVEAIGRDVVPPVVAQSELFPLDLHLEVVAFHRLDRRLVLEPVQDERGPPGPRASQRLRSPADDLRVEQEARLLRVGQDTLRACVLRGERGGARDQKGEKETPHGWARIPTNQRTANAARARRCGSDRQVTDSATIERNACRRVR